MQLPAHITAKLRYFQVEPANWLYTLLAGGVNCLDSSDCGAGKSYMALAAATALRLPALVIAPKISVTAWERVAAHFGEEVTVIGWEALRTGKTALGSWEFPRPSNVAEKTRYFYCINCQCSLGSFEMAPCFARHDGVHCFNTKLKPWNYGRFRFHDGVKFVIFDECHRAAARDSLNADMMIAARRANKLILGLSATPGVSPLQFRALGYALNLHDLTNFYTWARRHGCRTLPGLPGFHFLLGHDKQAAVMQRIHSAIIPSRGVRLRVDEIPGFPEIDIATELVDIDAPEKIDALYAEMGPALARLRSTAATDPSLAITAQLRQRQKIELLKVPALVELTGKYRDAGMTVIIFVNFRDTVAELSNRLETLSFIDGTVTGERRDSIIDAVQANRERILIVNSRAGAESFGAHDLDGNFPRMGLVCPGYDARNFRQVCGRLRREGGKSIARYRVVLAARSVEEKIQKALDSKLNCLDSLLDGDLLP